MRRSVFIIRHAKSDQHSFSNDFDRPLNERGKQDAPVMAKRLKEKQPAIDAIIASPAKRTETTAAFFADEYHIKQEDIMLIPSLYLAHASTIYDVIAGLPDDLQNIIVIAHNPGVTEFAGSITTSVSITNMPTCSIFAFTVNTASWKGFAKAKKEFLFFDYPKLQH